MLKPINYETYEVQTEGLFLKLQAGKTRVRIATPVFEIVQHEKNEGGKWSTVVCTGDGCEHCAKGLKKRVRFACMILNRSSNNQLLIWEFGVNIFSQIKAFVEDPEYGDPVGYDITVTKEGEKLATTYTIVPSPKKEPLNKDELTILDGYQNMIEEAYKTQ